MAKTVGNGIFLLLGLAFQLNTDSGIDLLGAIKTQE